MFNKPKVRNIINLYSTSEDIMHQLIDSPQHGRLIIVQHSRLTYVQSIDIRLPICIQNAHIYTDEEGLKSFRKVERLGSMTYLGVVGSKGKRNSKPPTLLIFRVLCETFEIITYYLPDYQHLMSPFHV